MLVYIHIMKKHEPIPYENINEVKEYSESTYAEYGDRQREVDEIIEKSRAHKDENLSAYIETARREAEAAGVEVHLSGQHEDEPIRLKVEPGDRYDSVVNEAMDLAIRTGQDVVFEGIHGDIKVNSESDPFEVFDRATRI